MKIKHYAGYGCVNAKKISKDTIDGVTTLIVEVTGDHEQGIIRRDDPFLVKRWLVERFDKSVREDPDWSIWSFDYTVEYDWHSEPERAIYTFTY